MPFHTSSSPIALYTIIAVTSYFLFTFQRPSFPSASPFFQSLDFSVSSSVFFTPLTSLFLNAFVVPWLPLPHEKGRSALPVLLRVKASLGLHKARRRRSWSAQLSLYETPGTPPARFSLRCLTVRLLPPLTLRCSLANRGLPVLPRFQIQGRF